MIRRRHYVLAALFFLAIAAYGSWAPLDFRPTSMSAAIRQFGRLLAGFPGQPISRTDWLANLLLFLPVGFCVIGALADESRTLLRATMWAPLALLACVAASAAIEFSQAWFPLRTMSLHDVVAQTAGASIGAAAWLALGRSAAAWLGEVDSRRAMTTLEWCLLIYCAGLLIVLWLPLDLSLRPGDLVHKYRGGRIELVPFAELSMSWRTVPLLAFRAAAFVPLGMLAKLLLPPVATGRRSPGRAVLLGSAAVIAIGAGQLLVVSRVSRTTDLVLGIVGMAIGVWAARRWLPTPVAKALPATNKPPSSRRTWVWIAVAALYSVALVIWFCLPWEWVDEPNLVRQRLLGFREPPLATLYKGSPFDGLRQILRKGLLFLPLGVLSAITIDALRPPTPVRRIFFAVAILLAAGVAITIEMLQVFMPSHYPNLTDVLLCTAGAVVGMAIVAMRTKPTEQSR